MVKSRRHIQYIPNPFQGLILVLGLLTGCGEMMSERLVDIREDRVVPEITFLYPKIRSTYYSRVNVKALVSDSSHKTGDAKGLLRSISFDVNGGVGNRNSRGGIKFDSRGQYVQDDSAGNARLTFLNGLLSFAFDVPDLGSLPLLMEIRVKATDFVGQESVNTISLIRSTGPYIQILSPDNSVNALLINSKVQVRGTISNSVLNTTARNELASLSLEIPDLSLPIRINLNLRKGEVVDGKIQQTDTITNGTLEYNTATGEYNFDFDLFNDLVQRSKAFTIKIIARDKIGIQTTATKSIIILRDFKPDIIFSQPQSPGNWYYSSLKNKFYHPVAGSTDELIFSGAVKSYRSAYLPDRVSLSVKDASTDKQRINLLDQDEVTLDKEQNTYSVRNYTIPISTFMQWANSATTPMRLILDVTRTDNRDVKNTKKWEIFKDELGPEISSFSFELQDKDGKKVTGRNRATPGEQIQVTFELNDPEISNEQPGSGIQLNSLSGNFHGTTLKNADFTIDNSGKTMVILPVTDALPRGVELQLSLNIQDNLGNTTEKQQTLTGLTVQ